MTDLCVADVADAIASRFPAERAESWDRVGMLVGDPAAAVTGVVCALDASRSTLQTAVDLGANAVVTHHPAFLTPPSVIRPGPGPAGVVHMAAQEGIALINAHTNLDRDREAQGLLPVLLGLDPVRPLETSPVEMARVTVFAPPESLSVITDAMTRAGAGRIGDYEGSRFVGRGVGAFTPSAGSQPYIGAPGVASSTEEARIEMVCPIGAADGVVNAVVAVHPYEEPLVVIDAVRIARGAAALGMVCVARPDRILGELAAAARERFHAVPRVWGDPDRPVGVAATVTGSAGSMIGPALSAEIDTLVCGEVRYHDALDALDAGLSIIELGHDVSEWPMVDLLRRTVALIPGMPEGVVTALSPEPAWWSV